jgi:hypothetical protein
MRVRNFCEDKYIVVTALECGEILSPYKDCENEE